jgi:hypothetical protein
MLAFQTAANINAQVLQVSRLEYAVSIIHCPLVVVVIIYEAVSAKTCLV